MNWKNPVDGKMYRLVSGDERAVPPTVGVCTVCAFREEGTGCATAPCNQVPRGYFVPATAKPRKAPKLQETSLKAHASQKDKAPSDCATILSRIRKYRTGTTCDKLEQMLGMSHQTTSARINDLVRKGRIRDSGRREKTRTGRLAICWKVVEA